MTINGTELARRYNITKMVLSMKGVNKQSIIIHFHCIQSIMDVLRIMDVQYVPRRALGTSNEVSDYKEK